MAAERAGVTGESICQANSGFGEKQKQKRNGSSFEEKWFFFYY